MKRIWAFPVISFGFLAFSISVDQASRPGFAASSAIDAQAFDQPIFSCLGNNNGTPSQPVDNTPHDTWVPTSTGTNMPSSRDQHSAIWTGSEMIIWGGYPSATTNTGGRYDLATDSWTPTSTSYPGGPIEFRRYHNAVWTETEMIIWGGVTPSPPPSNTGGKYNPETDTWIPISTNNVPFGAYTTCAQSAVWTGTEMVIWGGDCAGGGSNTGGRYNPSTDSWASTSTGTNVPEGRADHSAIWTGSEMIVWGGYKQMMAIYNDGGRYDPVSDSWSPVSTDNAPSARHNHTAIWTDSKMIIWGGDDSGGHTNTGGNYDPTSDTWTSTSTADAPSPRTKHTAIWTDSQMIIWGGYQNGGETNTGGKYDPVSDTWSTTSTTNSPSARQGHTTVWTGSQMIIWGGYGESNYMNTGGIYTP